MKLYEFGLSRSYKIRWLIKELEINCEFVRVNLMEREHLKEDFLKINPFGKVPALVDEDLILHEASAICNYLCDKNPERNLIPKPATKERAVFDKWNFFASNELECHLWACEKNTWGYPEDQRSTMAIETASSDFKKAMAIINKHLESNKYMLGNEFSVLDINYAYLIRWAKSRNLVEEYPTVLSYLDGLIDRPAYPKELFEKK